jgi:tRNA(fMet)-specific endonuclease VapC
MILLDTDHTTFLKYPDSERGRRMIDRLESVSASEVTGVAIVTVEERMRGWLAVIAKEKKALRQVVGYRELALLFDFYQEFEIVPFDEAAARRFDDLRRQKLRIGSRDLKIAATALVNHALLLSANRTDFERVPGLRVENWLDGWNVGVRRRTKLIASAFPARTSAGLAGRELGGLMERRGPKAYETNRVPVSRAPGPAPIAGALG